jgi:hypothetical protein
MDFMKRIANWSCSQCSFINHEDLEICEVCELKKSIAVENESNIISTATTCSLSGLFSLLVTSLNRSRVSYQLCSPTTLHFSQRNSFGSEWSCGYRNIQMLCSSLRQIPLYRNSLFNCDGIVPDIEEIQRWIELAWMSGFDVEVHFCFLISLTCHDERM